MGKDRPTLKRPESESYDNFTIVIAEKLRLETREKSQLD